MAVSTEGSSNLGGGGDRRKPLSADLNLVPYIDLLTCMVAFLLITAVWTQLATLQITQKGAAPGIEPEIERREKIAVPKFAVENRGGNNVPQAKIDRSTIVVHHCLSDIIQRVRSTAN